MFRTLAFFLGLSLVSVAPAAENPTFEEGTHYHWVAGSGDGGGQIEVIEFFWYGCPHCNEFEPHVKEWLAGKPGDVDFVRVPATFNRPNVMLHAKTFYALELMGAGQDAHDAIFRAMHDEDRSLNTQEEMEKMLAEQGVDIAAFRDALASFAVAMKVRQAAQMAQRYEIKGVPALVVDRQYRSGQVRSNAQMVELMDFLVVESREGRTN
ncbi:MAG: thiol:disulfide interchange protein DsbA/DsbL [Pseudomonadota bacterium]